MKKVLPGFKHSPFKQQKLPRRSKAYRPEARMTTMGNAEEKVKVDVKDCDKKNRKFTLIFNRGESLSRVKEAITEKLQTFKSSSELIVGFEKEQTDYAFDYKFWSAIGHLEDDLSLKCLHFNNSSGLEKYKICCCLAIGGFSKVFLVRSKANGSFYAAKFIDKQKADSGNYDLLENERQISSNVSSPYLVKTYEFIETPQFFVFIMDYCAGGQLFYLLKQIRCMREEQARVCFIQILLGIECIHNAGFMYRDLKPENILIDSQGYLKIADFGLAKSLKERSYSFCGSVEYMAPEILVGKGHEKYVDFYCLGAILYEMLMGYPPFYNHRSTEEQTKLKIINEDVKFPKDGLSDLAKDLIVRLTAKNQKQRLGYFGGCRQIMAHPWIGRVDRKMFEEKAFIAPFPTNLDILNFDPEEVGESERNFETKIHRAIEQSKSKNKKSRKSLQNIDKKTVLVVQEVLEPKEPKKSVPYRNKSLVSLVPTKDSKSPYQYALKRQKGRNSLKTEKSEQKHRSHKKNYRNTKFTEESIQLPTRNSKLFETASKLRKKCRYVPFMTIENDLESIVKQRKSVDKANKERLSLMYTINNRA